MTEGKQSTPGWMWIVGAIVVLALVVGTLQILDWIFSWQLLVLGVVGVGAYLWYRSRQKSNV